MSNSRIAIVGKAHSGKTTLAEALLKHNYRRIAFADPVKDIAADMLTSFVHNAGPKEKHQFFTREDINNMKGHHAIRKLLQLVGTELGREWLGPESIWIDLFEEQVKAVEHNNRFFKTMRLAPIHIVNDDCRFPNEAARLRELGFTIIKLVRDHDERMWSIRRALERDNPALVGDEFHIEMMMHDMLEHPSETNVDLIEADINVASESVEQLQAFATIIATEGLR